MNVPAAASATVQTTRDAAAPDAISGPESGAPTANADPCDAVVDDVKKNGPYGLVKIEGPLLEPWCRWRFDDANDAKSGVPDDAMMARFAEPGAAGTVVALRHTGSRPSGTVLPKMRALVRTIRECLDGETESELGPAIRLRVVISPEGSVVTTIFDYRVSVSEHRRDCVAFALQKQKFARVKDAEPSVFTLAFSLRK